MTITPDTDACAGCPASDCYGCTALVHEHRFDRDRLIAAIDTLHERAWAEGTGGNLAAHQAADALADALGWDGDHGTTPDGPWLRARLAEVVSR